MTLLDPLIEIRLGKLQTLRGPNFWSMRPVTRMDVSIGRYDSIPSSEIPRLTERLFDAMPGLIEHRCSIGERGGFLTRMRRGTYAAHVIEHVALELQEVSGYDVGFGRARGGDKPHEYTLVFEHRHSAVGLRAAQLAMETVQQAIAGTLSTIEHAVNELKALGETPDVPAPTERVRCAISGGGARHSLRDRVVRAGVGAGGDVVDVSPAYILEAGLPFASAEMAVLLDTEPRGVPERFTEPENARRLLTVVSDVVVRGGTVIVPAEEWEVHDRVREQQGRLAVFTTGEMSRHARRVAYACAQLRGGTVQVDVGGDTVHESPLEHDVAPEVQLAATLCIVLAQRDGNGQDTHSPSEQSRAPVMRRRYSGGSRADAD